MLYYSFSTKLPSKSELQSQEYVKDEIFRTGRVINSLHMIFIFNMLLIIQTIVSQVSGLVFPKYEGYLLVGFTSIGIVISFIVISANLMVLQQYLVRQAQISNDTESYQGTLSYFAFGLFNAGIIILFAKSNYIHDNPLFTLLGIVYAVISLLFVITLIYFTRNYITTLKTRLFLFYSMFVNFYIYFLINFSLLSVFPTTFYSNFTVELALLSIDIFALINCISLFLLISFPPFLQKAFKLTPDDILEKGDEILDRKTSYIKYYEFSENPIEHKSPTGLSHLTFSDISDGEPEYEELIKLVKVFLETPQILHLQGYYEPYFQKHVKMESNLLFVSSGSHRAIQELLTLVKFHYDLQVSYANYVTINKMHFNLKDRKFVFLCIFPSFWNYSKEIWIILSPRILIPHTVSFITTFKSYLQEKANEEVVFLLLHFLKEEGENNFGVIPADPSKPKQPNLDYLSFL